MQSTGVNKYKKQTADQCDGTYVYKQIIYGLVTKWITQFKAERKSMSGSLFEKLIKDNGDRMIKLDPTVCSCNARRINRLPRGWMEVDGVFAYLPRAVMKRLVPGDKKWPTETEKIEAATRFCKENPELEVGSDHEKAKEAGKGWSRIKPMNYCGYRCHCVQLLMKGYESEWKELENRFLERCKKQADTHSDHREDDPNELRLLFKYDS